MPRQILLLGTCCLLHCLPAGATGLPLVLDAYCATAHLPLHRNGADDDSPCLAAAVAQAERQNLALYIPAGGPITLAGGAQPLLDNIKLFSDDVQDRGGPATPAPTCPGSYGCRGATFWITDRTHPALGLAGHAVTIAGLNFYWPQQRNMRATPIVYPPLFALAHPGAVQQSFRFTDVTVINAYDFLDTRDGTIGNVDIGASTIWAVHDALRLSDVPEVFFVHDCLFSLAAAAAANTPLADWYAAHGTWLEVAGSTRNHGGAAIQTANVFVYGARFGIHVLGGDAAGYVYSGNITGGGFDAVTTILQADPGSTIGDVDITDQYWNVQDYAAPAAALPPPAAAVILDGVASAEVSFSNIHAVSNGSGFYLRDMHGPGPSIAGMQASLCARIAAGSCTFIDATGFVFAHGNQIRAGNPRTAVTGFQGHGTFAISDNILSNLATGIRVDGTANITGNQFLAGGIGIDATAIANIAGNQFVDVAIPVKLEAAARNVTINANQAIGATASAGFATLAGHPNVKLGTNAD